MTLTSALLRFAKAESLAVLFFLGLEGCLMASAALYRLHDPSAGSAYLVNPMFFWAPMAVCGALAALLLGGPCYLLCARFLKSKAWMLGLSGTVIAAGGLGLFGYLLFGADGGCGG